MEKQSRYRLVVEQRKACRRCECHLTNASCIEGGKLDCDEIGAYSQWQGNLDAELMVVAQDFADVDGFVENQGWAGERVQTNLTLVQLVAQAGIKINAPKRGIPDDRLFFTNAVLCMKRGGIQANVPETCFRECGRQFLRPMIELVAPKVVVTLGAQAMRAVCFAFGIEPPAKLASAVARPISLIHEICLMPMYHPSRTVLNAMRSFDAQIADWRAVGQLLSARPTKISDSLNSLFP